MSLVSNPTASFTKIVSKRVLNRWQTKQAATNLTKGGFVVKSWTAFPMATSTNFEVERAIYSAGQTIIKCTLPNSLPRNLIEGWKSWKTVKQLIRNRGFGLALLQYIWQGMPYKKLHSYAHWKRSHNLYYVIWNPVIISTFIYNASMKQSQEIKVYVDSISQFFAHFY